MTEAERILKTGILRPNFLNPELLCDYQVTEHSKKIWAISLDMLVQLDKVCKKHNLRYFLIFGTLLGAIRHKGFIPWDDDVDVAMPREDYEKLIAMPEEFSHPLFLQTPQTDPNSAMSYARIRNSNTTAIARLFKYQKMNHGIFLDIFPLDNYMKEEGDLRFEEIKSLNIDNGTFMRLSNPDLDEKNLERVKKYINQKKTPLKTISKIHDLAFKYNTIDTDFIAPIVLTITTMQRKIWEKKCFENVILADFEGLKFPIPIGYDSVLKQSFNNYLEYPPVELRKSLHSHYFIDPDKPYQYYLDNPSLIE